MGRFYVRGEVIRYHRARKDSLKLKAKFPPEAVVVDERDDAAGTCGYGLLGPLLFAYGHMTQEEHSAFVKASEAEPLKSQIEAEYRDTLNKWHKFRFEEATERVKNDTSLDPGERESALKYIDREYKKTVELDRLMHDSTLSAREKDAAIMRVYEMAALEEDNE